MFQIVQRNKIELIIYPVLFYYHYITHYILLQVFFKGCYRFLLLLKIAMPEYIILSSYAQCCIVQLQL